MARSGAFVNGAFYMLLCVILLVCAFTHMGFALFFFSQSIMEMVVFNVGSVLLYISLFFLLLRSQALQNPLIIALVLEFCLHAAMAVYYIGWDSGFSGYMIAVIAIVAVAKTSPIQQAAGGIALLVVNLGFDIIFYDNTPVYVLSSTVLDLTRMVNNTFALSIMVMCAVAYKHIVSVIDNEIIRLATSDNLTGLPNRHSLTANAREIIKSCHLRGQPICLALGDVDHFKSVNDTWGHTVGDEVLVSVAQTLQRSIRDEDLVGRWGGEEFVLVLPHVTLEDAVMALERARCNIQQESIQSTEGEVRVSITLGVVELHPGMKFHFGVDAADVLLYTGKQQGRNRVVSEPEAPRPPARKSR